MAASYFKRDVFDDPDSGSALPLLSPPGSYFKAATCSVAEELRRAGHKAAFGREKAFSTRMAKAAKPIDISIAWLTPASRAMRIHAKSRYAFSKLYPYGNETTLFCMPFRGLIPSLPRFPLPRQTKRDPPNHRIY